jgi:glutamine amidotransferase
MVTQQQQPGDARRAPERGDAGAPPLIGLIDVGAGNVGSVGNALAHVGARVRPVRAPSDLEAVDRVVLPGVGAFGALMDRLEGAGLVDALRATVVERGVPYLGICVGMQILVDVGLEFGARAGLGWIPGRCEALGPERGMRVPHIGWNDVEAPAHAGAAEPLLAGLHPEGGARVFYFVHSFHVVPADPQHIAAACEYGGPFAAIIRRGHIAGVQFHPEKSQAAGLAVLRAFARPAPGGS